jgi:hypothetical protein
VAGRRRKRVAGLQSGKKKPDVGSPSGNIESLAGREARHVRYPA